MSKHTVWIYCPVTKQPMGEVEPSVAAEFEAAVNAWSGPAEKPAAEQKSAAQAQPAPRR